MKGLSDPAARRTVVAFLLGATTINYIDRQSLSVLAPVLQREFSLTTVQYSYLVNSFLAVYSVMYLVAGRVVDRLGTRRGLGYAILCWSAAEILHAFAGGFASLCAARALLAVGEAAIIPSGVKAVAEWFEPKRRGLAIGTFEIGLSLGPLVAPPLVAYLAIHFGWRSAFVWTGVAGLLWAIPWLLFYRLPSAAPAGGERLPPQAQPSPRELLRSRQVWAVGLARFFGDPVWYFYLFWLPKYLADARGLTLQSIGAFAWIPYLGSMLGGFAGGAASSWLIRRGMPAPAARQRILSISSVAVSSGVLCIYLDELGWALAAIACAAFFMQFWGVNLDTLPSDLFPSNSVAQAVGVAGLLGSAGGIVFTAATGHIVERYGYSPVWVASAVMYPAGLTCLRLCLRPQRSRPETGIKAAARP